MFRANFDFRLQEGQGPSLFGFKPLEDFGINILFKANSGWHYTRQNYRGESVEERGASVAPWYYNTDLRADRRFRLFGRTYLTAFIEIYNLFNTTHILGLHARTGDPLLVGDEPEYQEANFTDGVSQGDPTWEWENVKDLDDDGHISAHEEYEAFMKSFLFLRRTASNFGPPRLVRFGFELNLD